MKLSKNYVIFLIIFIFSIAGIIASLILSIESWVLAKNSAAELSCNINSVFNCASVMKTPKAELLGFPNPFLGIAGYSFMATVAFIYLVDKKISNVIAFITLLGAGASFIFSYWLMHSSVFEIGILCLYCVISCTAATLITFSLLTYIFETFEFKNTALLAIQKFYKKGWSLPLYIFWIVAAVSISAYTIIAN